MEAAGVNDRAQLAVAEAELRDRINERWMRRGVTMWDPERTYVDAEVAAGARRVAPARGHPAGTTHGRRGRRDRPGLHAGRLPRSASGREVRSSVAVGREIGAGRRVGPVRLARPGDGGGRRRGRAARSPRCPASSTRRIGEPATGARGSVGPWS